MVMKIYRYCLLLVLTLAVVQPLFSQNKKFDKSLKKIDVRYDEGSFSKASSALQKLKKSIVAKMGAQNTYMPGVHIREAHISLALGVLDGFDKTLNTALAASLATFGENSASYAGTMIDIAEVYNEYGNFRLSREYTAKAKELLNRTNQLNDHLNARIGLVEAEAMTGQGFCNEALALLKSLEPYFAGRAVEKETTVQGGAIKTQRVPDAEIPRRYSDFAKLLTMTANAYGKKGSLLSADSAFNAAQTWISKTQKYMGETSLELEQNNYL